MTIGEPYLKDWPLVLAGPIVRRVELDSVTVWLALKEPRKVTLEVYEDDERKQVRLSGTRVTAKVGKNLYLVAVTARGVQPGIQLGTWRLYYYNLRFSKDLGNPTAPVSTGDDLFTAGVVAWSYSDASRALTYLPDGGPSSPSFATPARVPGALRVFHASCRKPHGEGEDALSILNEVVKSAGTSGWKRPQQLLLTGDQIYADDVADALLAVCMSRAETLMGGKEPFPGLSEASMTPGGRLDTMKYQFGMSSEEAKSHLATFGEFAAMYLLSWSPVLWPWDVLYDLFPQFYPGEAAELRRPEPGWPWGQAAEDHEKAHKKADKYNAEVAALWRFHDRLADVRRALANTPTYMMCDDHEISDDWYIALDWCTTAYGSTHGRTLIRNGLAAYAVFQAWGNTPAQFEPGAKGEAGRALLTALDPDTWAPAPPSAPDKPPEKRTTPDTASGLEIEKRVGLPTGYVAGLPQRPAGSLDFHYSIDFPAHQLVVLDTRTHREFPKGPRDPAKLIDDTAMAAMLDVADPGQEKVVLLVSPAPILGNPLMEGVIQPAMANSKGWEGFLEADMEAWGFQDHAFERLIAELLSHTTADSADGVRRRRVVALSGDVHYGFAVRMTYDAKTPYLVGGGRVQGVLAQMVSSSLKNQVDSMKGSMMLHKTGYVVPAGLLRTTRLGWANPSGAKFPIGSHWDTKRERWDPWELSESPAVTPYQATSQHLEKSPEWWYEVTYYGHEDPDAALPPRRGARETVEYPDVGNRSKAIAQYLAASKNHDDYRVYGHGKQIVGCDNIGEIQFKWDGDTKVAVQTLWWRMPDLKTAAPLTRFEVPLPLVRPFTDPSVKGA